MAKAVIAGGGIAGMAAALALRRGGWQADVLEQAEALGEAGAGLQMSPNACRALRHLGVLDEVRARSFVPEAAEMRDGITGTLIYRAPLGHAAEARWGAPYLHVHRADLLDVLAGAAEKAGATLALGAKATRVVDRGNRAAVHLADETMFEADLVIGAEGIRSKLRANVVPKEAPRFTGQIAWRALIKTSDLPDGLVAPNATVWAGPGGHVVTYYLRGGELVNIVAVREREDWTDEGWSAPGDPDALLQAFTGWHPSVHRLLSNVSTCFLWGLFDRPEQVRWTEGRLVLIGDAAHPMLPFMAQGAAMALEDVVVLRHQLDQMTDLPRALAAWEQARWSRVTRVLQRARANRRLFHHAPGPARWLARTPIKLVSRVAPGLAAGQLDWLYGGGPDLG